MKKVLGFLVFGILLFTLTGCGENKVNKEGGGSPILGSKSVTCTKTEADESGYKTDETLVINYTGSDVKKMTNTVTTETDAEYIDMIISMSAGMLTSFNELDGMTYTATKENANTIKYYVEVDYTKINPSQIKALLGDEMDADDLHLLDEDDMNIDSVKRDLVEDGYTCN